MLMREKVNLTNPCGSSNSMLLCVSHGYRSLVFLKFKPAISLNSQTYLHFCFCSVMVFSIFAKIIHIFKRKRTFEWFRLYCKPNY